MKTIAVGLLLTPIVSAGMASPYEDGLRQLDAKAFAEAAASFRRAADTGLASAERQLGAEKLP